MKRTQLIVLSVLALGLQGAAHAFPSDAEGNYNLAASSTHADRYAGTQSIGSGSPFPSDAEASYSLAASGSYAGQKGDSWAGIEVPFPSDAEAVAAMPVRAAPGAKPTVAEASILAPR